MMPNDPLVSVIVPCFNQAQYLPDALDSVLAQSYPNWECIIVNDGSPDNTEEVAGEWCKKDQRFKYFKKQNGGLSSARNAGINICSGEYILPLDADDKIGKDYLKEAVAVLEKDKSVKIVYAEAEYFGAKSGRWKLSDFIDLRSLALSNLIYCSAFFRKEDFENFGPYDETFKDGLEDWDLWISVLEHGGGVVKLANVHFYYRRKDTPSMVDLMRDEEVYSKTAMKIFVKHQELYLLLFGNPIEGVKENILNKNLIEGIKMSRSYRISNYLNGVIKRLLP